MEVKRAKRSNGDSREDVRRWRRAARIRRAEERVAARHARKNKD